MTKSNAPVTITSLHGTPGFTHGVIRDIRIRWACEEIGRPYEIESFYGMEPRPDSYLQSQPFGQVPTFDDGEVHMFESGAMLLYLGEQDERLLPREPQPKWDATAWLFAALNSVEPALFPILTSDIFLKGRGDWVAPARQAALKFAQSRLQSVADALGDKEWLTGRFTIADIMMVTVLRNVRHTDIVAGFPSLAAYQQRGEARSAFQRAEAAQIADVTAEQPQGADQ